jgi:hypothetical protein
MATQSAKTKPATIQKQYQLLPVIGPSAGVDLRSSPTLMAPERARTLVNFSLEEPGALVVRPGYEQFSTTSLGNSRLRGGARIYLNTAVPSAASTMFTLVAFSGGVYNQNDTGGWVSTTPSLTGLSTNEIFFPADRDLVAVFDGASTAIFKSTNGSSWTRFGIAPGTVASTASTKTGGSLSTSEFEFSYTYKDRDLAFESNGSTALSTVSLTSTGAIELQVPNSTDAQVDAICVYARNKTSGETVKRKASSFTMQAGAHSTITITSSAWTTNDEMPDDHSLPPTLSFGVIWKNRWWARSATTTNRIYFTQLFMPQAWPALFFIDIPFERGDAIQALVPLGDTLLVFGTTKVFVIIGQTSLDFEVRPTIGSQDGAFGPRAVTVIENAVVHASATGVYAFDGTADKLLEFDLEPGWRDLVENSAGADLARIACVNHQKRKEVRISVPRRYPSGTLGEWIMDLSRSRGGNTAWTATGRNIAFYIIWDGPETAAGNRGRLFGADSTSALLYEEATGYSANSSNLVAEYEGPGLTLGAFRGRWVDVRGEYEPHSGDLAIEAVVDGVSQGSQTINIGAGLAQWGTAIWGISRFGGSGRRQFHKMLPLSADGRTFVLKMVYAGQERFKLYSYHVGLVPESQSRAFSE